MEQKPFYRQLLEDAIADAQIEALRKVQEVLEEIATRIEDMMYNDEARNIYIYGTPKRHDEIYEKRRVLLTKARRDWETCGTIAKMIRELKK